MKPPPRLRAAGFAPGPARAHRMVQRQRNGRRRGIAVLVHRTTTCPWTSSVCGQCPPTMRMLAWCGISQSISASVSPPWLQGRGRFLQHTHSQLEHRLPIHLEDRVAPSDLAARHCRHTQNINMLAIGVQVARQDARRIEASSTTAPAPSPNNTQVVRSLGSRMRLKTSAPIHQARGWPHRSGSWHPPPTGA